MVPKNSIQILFNWLAFKENYSCWHGDTKTGATKSGLEKEILLKMAGAGITHRDKKGIKTKLQDLQHSYSKASNFLWSTGSGLVEEDIDHRVTTLPSVSLSLLSKSNVVLILMVGLLQVPFPKSASIGISGTPSWQYRHEPTLPLHWSPPPMKSPTFVAPKTPQIPKTT